MILTNDRLTLLILSSACIIIYFFFEPFHQGFYCDDRTIQKKFKELIITFPQIVVLTVGLPLSLFWYTNEHKQPFIYFFGYLCNLFIVLFTKFMTGRLRPHFIDICEPNVDCTLAVNQNRFIEDYECTNVNVRVVRQGRQSFYSGHASISIFFAIYFVFYIHKKYAQSNRHGSIVHLVQFFLLLLGLTPGFTQVLNNWHHWTDVSLGFFVGTLFSYLTFFYVNSNLVIN